MSKSPRPATIPPRDKLPSNIDFFCHSTVKDDDHHERSSAPPLARLAPAEQLAYAREIIQIEDEALDNLARRLDTEFCRAVQNCITARETRS